MCTTSWTKLFKKVASDLAEKTSCKKAEIFEVRKAGYGLRAYLELKYLPPFLKNLRTPLMESELNSK